jgi:Patatin-like phospholipase
VAEADRKTSDRETLIDDTTPSALGVAISGGGVRAAFYGAGALLYMVHSGLNKNVKLISSVSGGSISNIVIAMNCDFSQVDRDSFDPLMSTMCHRLSRRGIFFLILLLPGLMGVLAGNIVSGALFFVILTHAPVRPKTASVIFFLLLGSALALAYGAVLMLLRRRSAQINVYSRFLNSLYRRFNRPEQPPKALADLPERQVVHVLCATELGSGQPFLMTRRGLVSPAFGKSRHTKLSVAQTVYASAAFPVVFPPLKVRSEELDFSGGPEDEPPKKLYLADGGVFNNLATEGLATLITSAEQKYLVEPIRNVVPVVQRSLVINASAPPSTRHIGLLKLNRTMSVMYESTLRPRIERLMEQESTDGGPIVIDVAESPIELAERIALGCPAADDPVAKRARASIDYLGKIFTDAQWKNRANSAARTKTVLSAVGRRTAVRLVFLGYLNAAIGCNAHLDAAGIESVPAETWFGSLLDDDLPDARGEGFLEASLSEDRAEFGVT